MSPTRAAAAFASVLLIIIIVAIMTVNRPRGFLVDIAAAPESCGDARIVIATVHSNQTVQINSQPSIDIPALRPRLREIFRTRAERVVFVRADPEVSFQEFVDIIGELQSEVEIVSWITPEVEERLRTSHCLVPGCGGCSPKKPWFTGVRVE